MTRHIWSSSTTPPRTLLSAHFLGSGWIWIGLHDQNNEGIYEWVTGAPFSYENWNVGEPNNVNDEDCNEMLDSRKWDDYDCNIERRFVCECDPAYTP